MPSSPVADQLLVEAEPALRGERSIITQHEVHNYDRLIGAGLAGEIARRYGNVGLPGVSVTCNYTGSAGQSFGAFNVSGMRLILHGDANDYVGKGMNGGPSLSRRQSMPHSPHRITLLSVILSFMVRPGATSSLLAELASASLCVTVARLLLLRA